MKFDIYCDESEPDLFSSKNPKAQYLVIGGLWLQCDDRALLKARIHTLRKVYKVGPEFKWHAVSPSREAFYRELIELFFEYQDSLRFRCIAVDHAKVDLVRYHQNDQELGFYKFYYQLLHHWILDFNEYSIFCDQKRNREPDRLIVLKDCLRRSNLSSQIAEVKALHSEESVLLQLCDVLTGAASARLNNRLKNNSTKERIVRHLELGLHHPIVPTSVSARKFNVFKIKLEGGW